MIKQIYNRLRLLSASGVLDRVDGKKAQVKVLDEEVLSNVKMVTPYGFSHGPKPGAQSHMAFPGGDRSFGIALIVGDTRYDMQLSEGEVSIHDDSGNYVHLKQGGTVKVKASTKVIADTPTFECTDDCKVGGKLSVTGDVDFAGNFTVRGKDVSDLHRHISAGSGSPTSPVI